MPRSDRLYAIVDELRARAPSRVTRRELADRFEVSSRTIERDIEALLLAGVPVWSDPGRDGGYSIVRATSMPPLNLTPEEAVAIVVALATSTDLPYQDAGRRARAKLLSGMREADVRAARELADRVRIGPVADDAMVAAELRAHVEAAVAERRVGELTYRDRKRRSTRRVVEAHGLYLTGGHWYLVAWCRTREAGRVFRLDRVEALRLTEERAAERPIADLSIWVTQGRTVEI
ncbi:helix-turn-helix transcriptional regulator [Jiangella ureilytica]|nr:YafY family protein [Jiangella ureilytica]